MASVTTRLQELAVRIGVELKAHKVLINGNAVDLSALSFGTKSNLVASLNELKALLDQVSTAAGATINDAATNTTTQTYSVNKIRDLVTTSINDLTANAPAALNTLAELAAALGNDGNFAATFTTALGNRVRTDIANQGLTLAQQNNARSNIGAVAADAVGNTDTDLVAAFNAALLP